MPQAVARRIEFIFPMFIVVAGLLIAGTLPASATFPGKNGRIAFIAGPDVYTMNPDGSDVKQLTNLGPDHSAFWESWSPDGKQIVFSEYPASDFIAQLWLMNADGSNRHLLLAENDFINERASFTPDGSSVVFSRCRTDIEACAIYRIGVAGGSLTAITDFELGIQDWNPQYSARGDLAFNSLSRGGILSAIYLRRPDDEPLQQLTPAPLTLRQPNWSPDGRRIVAASHYGTPQNEEIWVFDTDGDGLRQLTDNGNDYFNRPHDFQPAWSPQGDSIVFVRLAPDFSSRAIYMIKVDGTGCRKLVDLHRPAHVTHEWPKAPQSLAKSAIATRHLTQIEEGGAVPQWGVASN
jgi:Tol biopolymer transport system component